MNVSLKLTPSEGVRNDALLFPVGGQFPSTDLSYYNLGESSLIVAANSAVHDIEAEWLKEPEVLVVYCRPQAVMVVTMLDDRVYSDYRNFYWNDALRGDGFLVLVGEGEILSLFPNGHSRFEALPGRFFSSVTVIGRTATVRYEGGSTEVVDLDQLSLMPYSLEASRA